MEGESEALRVRGAGGVRVVITDNQSSHFFSFSNKSVLLWFPMKNLKIKFKKRNALVVIS